MKRKALRSLQIVALFIVLVTAFYSFKWKSSVRPDIEAIKNSIGDRVVEVTMEKSNGVDVNKLGDTDYLMLVYSTQLIDMSDYMAELFGHITVKNNGGSEEDYNNAVVDLNSKYEYYKNVPKKYNIFCKYIDLDSVNPIDLENNTLVSGATEDVTNGMNELIKVDKIDFVNTLALLVVFIAALIDWPFTNKKNNKN